jgi:hypothetical protein
MSQSTFVIICCQRYWNGWTFLCQRQTAALYFIPEAYRRLTALKAQVDPENPLRHGYARAPAN